VCFLLTKTYMEVGDSETICRVGEISTQSPMKGFHRDLLRPGGPMAKREPGRGSPGYAVPQIPERRRRGTRSSCG
jgi:hypothetical protein